MSSTLLIRLSKGKVRGVTGTITGYGQQANERVRRGGGEIDSNEITEGYE